MSAAIQSAVALGTLLLGLAPPVAAAVGPLAPTAGDPDVVLTPANGSAGLSGVYTKGNGYTLGAAWIDYNGDHWPDLFVTNGSGLQHRLFRNNGDGTFSAVSGLVAKPDLMAESAAVVFGDLDNDGDSDLVVIVDNPTPVDPLGTNPVAGGQNLLYWNQDGLSFVEGGSAAGIVDPTGHRNVAAGLADYDHDGFLDLYVGSWRLLTTATTNDRDRLLRNLGNGTFANVSSSTRVDGYGRDTLSCLWFDADLDGWQDLYVGTMRLQLGGSEPFDLVYGNHHEGGHFCNVTGNPRVIGNDAASARGLDVGDVDNDGDWDLYVTDQSQVGSAPLGNVLYLGTGDGRFDDNSCDTAGVCGTDSFPCGFADFDRDGWVDLWVGTESSSAPDLLYHNQGDGTFVDLQLATLTGNRARGGASADYDGDGDVDVFVVNQDMDSVLYRNDSPNTRNWLELHLTGTQSNRDAIGALVRVTAGGVTQMRRVTGGDGSHSQSELIVHFGLAAATDATVEIQWPSGAEQTFTAVPANELHFVDEGQGLLVEALTSATAIYDISEQELFVSVQSSFAGRTGFQVEGFGPLSYEVGLIRFAAVFVPVAVVPGTLTLTSSRGGIFSVAVTEVP